MPVCITLEHYPIPGKRSWTWRFKSWLRLPALPWGNHWNSVSSLQNGDNNVHSVFYKDGRGTKSVITDIKMVWKKCLSIKQFKTYCCCSASCSVMSDSLQSHGLHNTRLPRPSPSPRVCSNSCPLSRWCHPIISSSDVPVSFCLQSLQYYHALPSKYKNVSSLKDA